MPQLSGISRACNPLAVKAVRHQPDHTVHFLEKDRWAATGPR
ncbi:protein ROOT HAIR DEFECTIVE 3-like protein [Corchorus olitorius]|uniref:Protein ROOT HAIR DEFECTIVE 3-like protein n=1 Tax=Corchorus olitorius TaxID=93759 RepID=A0A1R3FU69_9ROSI|nr:protein ROOT HAIR DEFECTIVE 3-like protein [Corchorus olitorius]